MFCNQCGAKLKDNSAFCHICGAKIEGAPAQPQFTEAAPVAPAAPAQPPEEEKEKKTNRGIVLAEVIGAVVFAVLLCIYASAPLRKFESKSTLDKLRGMAGSMAQDYINAYESKMAQENPTQGPTKPAEVVTKEPVSNPTE